MSVATFGPEASYKWPSIHKSDICKQQNQCFISMGLAYGCDMVSEPPYHTGLCILFLKLTLSKVTNLKSDIKLDQLNLNWIALINILNKVV